MGAMENKKVSSCAWWSGNHSAPTNQSQWLQTTLSDLDEKTKAMLAVIHEEGDSFAQRAEMYYKKRPELIKMIQELLKSYRSLAERYDQLRAESAYLIRSQSSSSSNSFKQTQNHQSLSKDSKLDTPDSQSTDEDTDVHERNPSKFYSNKISDEFVSVEPKKTDSMTKNITPDDQKAGIMSGEFAIGNIEKENTWSRLRLQVSKLMEDNLKQQAELIKRNDEKREAIKDLCSQLDKVMDENRTLQNCLRCSKVGIKHNQSQMSKLKGLILGKFAEGAST